MLSIIFFYLNTTWYVIFCIYISLIQNSKILKGSTRFLLSALNALHFLKTQVGLMYFLYASPLTVDALDVRSELQLLRPKALHMMFCDVLNWRVALKALKNNIAFLKHWVVLLLCARDALSEEDFRVSRWATEMGLGPICLSLALDLATRVKQYEISSKSYSCDGPLDKHRMFFCYFDHALITLFSGGNWRTLGPHIHSSGATCTWRSGFSWCSSLPSLFLRKKT